LDTLDFGRVASAGDGGSMARALCIETSASAIFWRGSMSLYFFISPYSSQTFCVRQNLDDITKFNTIFTKLEATSAIDFGTAPAESIIYELKTPIASPRAFFLCS
jgi:hypothetical protein